MRSAVGQPGKGARMLEPSRNERVALREGSLDRACERIRVVWVGAHRSIAARFVKRCVRRDDAGYAAGHRLDDGHAEALEERWVNEDARTPIQIREIVVRRVAEPKHADLVKRRLIAPACLLYTS